MPTRERAEDAVNQYEQRRRDTQHKLREALERLVAGQSAPPKRQNTGPRFTVAALAREAGVGRNAIYNNHRALLEELRHAARQENSLAVPEKDQRAEYRATIEAMKINERRLLTENAVLLQRAQEAEAEAALHRQQNARLQAERDGMLRLPSLVPRKSY